MDILRRIFWHFCTPTLAVRFFTTLLTIVIPIGIAFACYALHISRLARQSHGGSLYSDLDLDNGKNEIRLLIFRKRRWWKGRSKPIHCEFVKVSLDPRPQFTALSYTWGGKGNSEAIFINGKEVPIQKNLHDALLQIQICLDKDHQANQYGIWADAICINQSNDLEKNSQVKKMDKIYQSASRVIAYLGPEKDNCHIVFDECNNAGMRLFYSGLLSWLDQQAQTHLYQRARQNRAFFLQFVRSQWANVQTYAGYKLLGILSLDAVLYDREKRQDLSKDVPLVASGEDSEIRAAWRSFCQRSFWTRVWILQELALGNEVTLQAGGKTTKLEYFLSLFCLCSATVRATANNDFEMRQHRHNVTLMADVYGDAYDLINCIFRSKQRDHDLETLIYDTQLLQAEKNVDKIYALRGLATDTTELGVNVDYGKSFEDSCRELSKQLILKRGVPALSYTRSTLDSTQIESWVNIYCLLRHDPPNKVERKLMPMSSNRFEGDFPFSASGEFSQSFDDGNFDNSKLPVPTRLSILGFAVSTISEVMKVDFDHRQYWKDQDEEADFKEALKMHKQLTKLAGDSTDDRLWWIPIRHRDPRIRISEESNYLRLHQSLLYSYHMLKEAAVAANGSTDRVVLEQTQLYRRIVRQCVEDQAFFTTSDHLLGMGSSTLHEGDKIVIFLGGGMPFAVRHIRGDTYRLLGEVYVLGIMHGEFLAKMNVIQKYLLQ